MTAASPRPLLEMLGEILGEHDSAPAETVILPCLTDDLSFDINIVVSTVKAAGGIVFNTTKIRAAGELPAERESYRAPTVGSATSLAGSAVVAGLRYRRGGVEYQVDLVNDGSGNVDARYVSPVASKVPAPTPKDPLLALVRALSSERFEKQTGRLAVVIYDESEMDAAQRSAAWEMSAKLDGLALGHRTIVILAVAGDIDLGRHVRPKSGFRYAHHGKQVVRRSSEATALARVGEITRGSSDFIGFFLGAGFSASSGLALGNSLRDDSIAAMVTAAAGASSTELAAAFYRKVEQDQNLLDSERSTDLDTRISNLTLERVLREEYRVYSPEAPPTLRQFEAKCNAALGAASGSAPRDLARLIGSGRKLVICTVNFDELVEHHAPAGSCRVFATESDFADAPAHLDDYLADADDQIPVWKLHGTITDLHSCVASDDRTMLGLSDNKRKALDALIAKSDPLRPTPWLYVGASMRDTDLNPLWGRSEFSKVVREYWVSPYPVQTVMDFVHRYRAEAWRQDPSGKTVEQHMITETADVFLKQLADIVAPTVP